VTSRTVDQPSEDVAIAFVRLEKILDRIRRGELRASAEDHARITEALNAIRALRPA
jgi:predicted RNA-binding protein